jgi:Uma2 family endonuclease
MTIVHAGPDRVLRSLRADWSRERWEQLPNDGNRYEVIDGILYMTTAPSAFHQWIVRQIVRALFAQIDDLNLGVTLWAPIGVFMPGCDPVQPDILVVQTAHLGIIHDRRIYGVPDLIVEVVSPSNSEQDLDIKRRAYARAAVPEYWIVRPAERDALVCSEPDPVAELFQTVDTIPPTGVLASPTLPIQASIADFFANAPDATL